MYFFFFLGVLMWEVFTEGKMPFEKSSNYEVVTMVSQGHRLYRPKLACKQVYEMMMMCWQEVYIFFSLNWKKVNLATAINPYCSTLTVSSSLSYSCVYC